MFGFTAIIAATMALLSFFVKTGQAMHRAGRAAAVEIRLSCRVICLPQGMMWRALLSAPDTNAGDRPKTPRGLQ